VRAVTGWSGPRTGRAFSSKLEWFSGCHRLGLLAPDPRIAVDVEVDLVAVGIVHVDGLADPMVLGSYDLDAGGIELGLGRAQLIERSADLEREVRKTDAVG